MLIRFHPHPSRSPSSKNGLNRKPTSCAASMKTWESSLVSSGTLGSTQFFELLVGPAHVVPAPARTTGLFPPVEVLARPAQVDHAVDRAGAAEDTTAWQPVAAIGRASLRYRLVVPVDLRSPELEVLGRCGDERVRGVPASLDQRHVHATGRPSVVAPAHIRRSLRRRSRHRTSRPCPPPCSATPTHCLVSPLRRSRSRSTETAPINSPPWATYCQNGSTPWMIRPVVQESDDQEPDERPERGSLTTRQRRAPEDDGGHDGQLEPGRGRR